MQPSLRRFTHVAAAALALALGAAGSARAADPQLLEAARAAEPALIQSLKDMVSIESGSANAAGLAQMASFTEGRLKALGATTERIAVTRGPGTMVKGTFTGTGKRRIMLIAHMDTVYGPNTLATQPIRLEGNRLYGPGIADDKGGIAVILHALALLKSAGWQDYAQITVLFNPDEEVGSPGSGDTIARLAEQHDVVLSCEPSAGSVVMKGQPLLLASAGVATATLDVKGRAAHAGAAPELGRNALYELSYQMLQTRDVAKDVPGAALVWTRASANGPLNQITEKAEAVGDVRLTQPGALEKLQAALQAKLASGRLIPDTETTLTLTPGHPPYVADQRSRALAARAQGIYKEIDRELTLVPQTGGGTDAGYAARSGKPTVLESFGLAGFGYHARDEYIEIDSIVPRLYLLTRILQEIGRN
ncbi:M20/M25/M40 family metallo-hydrolase [Cupriavidus basilensis]|uniref:M20/M25/M40 family metallo-hydrolase n=1 Tax=Cupriavidus basilensis TaxID=68895 RepID=A0ABT6AXQ1_9BURK|nr:M20/M25/M40 family metallo-hydrolase [Cupriavidus basilensis]MDF3837264.1 M20/M25/M40 family metallo-hydrolase [Cupriavidus basilensis]